MYLSYNFITEYKVISEKKTFLVLIGFQRLSNIQSYTAYIQVL